MLNRLLATKISIPPLRPRQVARPRLVAELHKGLNKKLVLVSAPAGSGKTTLLANWGGSRRQGVAWYSIDESDNDLEHFLSYLAAAIQTVAPAAGDALRQRLHPPQLPSSDELVASLVNPLSETTAPLYLVLDDYHLISDPLIQDWMSRLVERQPPHLHLLLATRTDPPWPLARLRARDEILELRAPDLRFSGEEAAQFLNEVCEMQLGPADIARIEDRTEGWAAGLQIAALALRGRENRAAQIESFARGRQWIVAYLLEEVIAHQPPALREFLSATAILDRFTPPLCDALLGQTGAAQAALAQIEAANLFLIPLDESGCWYRYHPLFAEALRSQLAPERLPELHRRASRWLAAHGLAGAAIQHALAGGDWESLAGLVANNALLLTDFGELNTLLRRLEATPAPVQPWLQIAHAWALAYAGHFERAAALIGGPDPEPGSGAAAHRAGHRLAIRAYIDFLSGDYPAAIQGAQAALNCLPAGDRAARATTLTILGGAQISPRRFQEAEQNLTAAMRLSAELGQTQAYVMAASWAIYLLKQQACLRRARELCQTALAFCEAEGGPLPVAGSLYLHHSSLLSEANEMPAALEAARIGFELSQRWGQMDTLVFAHLQLASAYQLSGQPEKALQTIAWVRANAEQTSPWFAQECRFDEAWLYLLQGNTAAAGQLIAESGLNPDDTPDAYAFFKYTVLAMHLLAEQRSGEAARLLERLLALAESSAAGHSRIIVLTLLALAYAPGERSLACLRQALEAARPEGYLQTFLLRGAPMQELLQKALAQGICPAYTRQILAAFAPRSSPAPAAPMPQPESLSEREMEILNLLAQSLSAPEIARRLYLSNNTVRTHIKNIYAKLGVHTRWELVSHARQVGLL